MRYHAGKTTGVQCCNDAVVDAISCRQHNSRAVQKHANELDSADLELSLPESDDAPSLCDSNHPLRENGHEELVCIISSVLVSQQFEHLS